MLIIDTRSRSLDFPATEGDALPDRTSPPQGPGCGCAYPDLPAPASPRLPPARRTPPHDATPVSAKPSPSPAVACPTLANSRWPTPSTLCPDPRSHAPRSLRIRSAQLASEVHETHRLTRLIGACPVGVGVAEDTAVVCQGKERPHAGAGLAPARKLVLVQPGVIAPRGDGREVQRQGLRRSLSRSLRASRLSKAEDAGMQSEPG